MASVVSEMNGLFVEYFEHLHASAGGSERVDLELMEAFGVLAFRARDYNLSPTSPSSEAIIRSFLIASIIKSADRICADHDKTNRLTERVAGSLERYQRVGVVSPTEVDRVVSSQLAKLEGLPCMAKEMALRWVNRQHYFLSLRRVGRSESFQASFPGDDIPSKIFESFYPAFYLEGAQVSAYQQLLWGSFDLNERQKESLFKAAALRYVGETGDGVTTMQGLEIHMTPEQYSELAMHVGKELKSRLDKAEATEEIEIARAAILDFAGYLSRRAS